MPQLFRAEVTIHATAYIVADDAAEAAEILATMPNTGIEVDTGWVSEDLIISGESFSPDMPELSLSPAMTIGAVELDPEGENFDDL